MRIASRRRSHRASSGYEERVHLASFFFKLTTLTTEKKARRTCTLRSSRILTLRSPPEPSIPFRGPDGWPIGVSLWGGGGPIADVERRPMGKVTGSFLFHALASSRCRCSVSSRALKMSRMISSSGGRDSKMEKAARVRTYW